MSEIIFATISKENDGKPLVRHRVKLPAGNAPVYEDHHVQGARDALKQCQAEGLFDGTIEEHTNFDEVSDETIIWYVEEWYA